MKTKFFMRMMIFLSLSFISCSKISNEDANWQYKYDPQPTKSANFVKAYVVPTEFEAIRDYNQDCPPNMECVLLVSEEEWVEREWSVESLVFSISRKDPAYIGFDYDGRGQDVSKFQEIAKQNKDVSYNDYYWNAAFYYNEPAKAINMSCTTDYDSEHTANASLNDIVDIKYFTAKPFLDSRYKNKRLGDTYYSRTREPLPLFISKKVPLVAAGLGLHLTKNPEKAGIYSFTITYVDSQGKEYSATSKPTRLEARQ